MPEKKKYQDKNHFKITSSTPTPTNFISNPCKFRGKTIDILGVISNSGGMTTREIADQTGMPIKTVNVYCWLGEKRGILERKERWGWIATSFGLFILSINNNNDKSNINKVLIKDKSSINHLYTVPKESHQLNLSIFTSRSDIADPERVVVEVLVGHYERTGEKYRYFRDLYHFCDETGVSAVDAPTAIARLKEEGCIYTRKDEFGWKIGLKVGFVERLKFC
ncbi:MAG: hypothetical protein MPEBLZ_03598 [Candidatus Methanoperedens nitroreducens]|uniref:Uncharacterized protein n=1 Tax=Candidatus Methanoperedens nitratireducens TaxID=1392998 RepID=A0A0P8A5K6_9EURY|nr:helix-turn-helix domain-containing protein [Candidatus Methanoperedens sp. BLZ2]KAB2947000.1 MAG: winged helix-turn-helix domain-containing protein [Candidatus Methanoperedens sp.]KPQ41839.1 MAG: hypothetical protein MPEBLZ_03598 [Candidatus Methanoperedens sp. BLZ1]MBZ0176803.1 winged helix-turn-helix domain-containing protein [Candidatus Methanoperedens nitroreducens]MCX9080525.1 helix-turn-helix domain-containing protein [Candidatus Methanoperedens sp.]